MRIRWHISVHSFVVPAPELVEMRHVVEVCAHDVRGDRWKMLWLGPAIVPDANF